MERYREHTNNEEIDKDTEKTINSFLEEELRAMENRKTDIRREGKGDPKYEILLSFLRNCQNSSFEQAYRRLEKYEKHTIIACLENQALLGNIPYDFAEKLRRELYGVVTDEKGERINFEEKVRLEQKLQDLWKKQT